jgi:hypothetical protein
MTTLVQTLGSVDITTKELSRRLLYAGYTKKIDCKNYWDSHGTKVPYAPTQYKFDCEKKFEIWEVVTETHYPSINHTQTYTDWRLVVEGKSLDPNLGWVVGYDHLKTKLKLDCCVGCG